MGKGIRDWQGVVAGKLNSWGKWRYHRVLCLWHRYQYWNCCSVSDQYAEWVGWSQWDQCLASQMETVVGIHSGWWVRFCIPHQSKFSHHNRKFFMLVGCPVRPWHTWHSLSVRPNPIPGQTRAVGTHPRRDCPKRLTGPAGQDRLLQFLATTPYRYRITLATDGQQGAMDLRRGGTYQ